MTACGKCGAEVRWALTSDRDGRAWVCLGVAERPDDGTVTLTKMVDGRYIAMVWKKSPIALSGAKFAIHECPMECG